MLNFPFKKKPGPTDSSKTDNPYLEARREWNERYGDVVAAASQWKAIAFMALATTFLLAIGVIYFGAENHITPYVVEVDKLGNVASVGRADTPFTPDSRIIRSQLAHFIINLRTIYPDVGAERQLLNNAYALLDKNGAAYNTLNEYFRTHDPFTLAQTQTVNIKVESVLPLSPSTWRVEWTEETRDRTGKLTLRQEWQATLTVSLSTPTTDAEILANPVGLYISDLNWSVRL